MADKIVITELDIDIEALTKKNAELLGQLTALKENQKGLKKETDNLNNANDKQLKTYVKTDTEIKKLNTEYNQQKTILAETTTGVNNLSGALNKEVKTVKEAQKNNSKLVKLRGQLNVKTKEGQKAITQINTKMAQNSKVIKDNSSALEKQHINIGNYGSALDKVVPGLGSFITGLTGTTAQLGSATKGLNIFRIALIGTGILAVVVLLASLSAAFKNSEEGQNKFRKITEVIGVVMGNLSDVLGNIGEKIIEVFENPKEAIMDFVNLVKNNIINRFVGLAELIPQIGKAITLLFKGEFKEAGKTAADAVAKVTLGVENFTDKVSSGYETATNAVKTFIKETDKEIGQAKAMSDLIARTDKLEREQIVRRAKLESKIADMRLKAREEDKYTAEQRRGFLIEAREAGDSLAATDLKIAENRAKIIQQQNSFSKSTKENLDAQAAAEAEVFKVQATRANFNRQIQRELIKTSREVTREKAAEAKKEVEVFKAKLAEQREEEKIHQQAAVAEKALFFEEETIRLEEEGATRLAIKLLELNEKERLEREKIDQSVEDEKIKQRRITLLEKEYSKVRTQIKKEEEMAKLSLIGDIAGQAADVLGRETVLGKAAAIAQATINTYKGANLALATLPPPFGAISAGLTVAAGLKSVAKITGISLPKFAKGTKRIKGDGTETSDSVPALLSKNERIVDAKNNRKIGFDLSNDQLSMAAQMYRSFNFNGGVSYNSSGIIGAINDNTETLKKKRASQTNVHVSENLRVVNESIYLT